MSNLTPEVQSVIDAALEWHKHVSKPANYDTTYTGALYAKVTEYKQKQLSAREEKLKRPFYVDTTGGEHGYGVCRNSKEEGIIRSWLISRLTEGEAERLCVYMNDAYTQACEDYNVFEK